MPCIAQDRRRVLALFLVAMLSSVGLIVLGPSTPAYATAGTDDYPSDLKNADQDSKTDPWNFYNRECTSFVAWRLNNDNGVAFKNQGATGIYGNATTWKDRAVADGKRVDDTPNVGAVAWFSFSATAAHVAWVGSVSSDGKSITIEDYNSQYNGLYDMRTIKTSSVTKFLHFGGEGSGASGGGSGGGSSAPQIFALKRTTDPNGVRQVYAGTNTAVTEGWWIPGGDGVHTHEIIRIDQHNIVGFDKVNLPGGTQAVYAAVSDGVWESWWKPDGSSGWSKIITGLSNVKGVFAWNDTESGQFVHHLYILAGDGPHEAWWKDGGDSIHLSLLTSIPGGINFTMLIANDGTLHLFVAAPTWVYDVWWNPGLNNIQVRAIINVSQADIRMVTADTFQSTGLLLYTMTSTTVWQSYWTPGSGIETHAAMANQVNTVAVKKTNYSDAHQLYLATADHVQEFWWKDNGASGGGEVFRLGAGQNNIGMIDKVADGSIQDLYTGASNWVYETWWGGGASPTNGALFSVAH